METFVDFDTVKLINQARIERWQQQAARSTWFDSAPDSETTEAPVSVGWRRTVGFWLMRCGMRLAGVAQ